MPKTKWPGQPEGGLQGPLERYMTDAGKDAADNERRQDLGYARDAEGSVSRRGSNLSSGRRSNSQTRCLLSLAGSLPSFVEIPQYEKNVISDPQNGRHFPRTRSFEVKFKDNVPLTLAISLPSFC